MFSMLAASGIFYHFLSQFRHRRLVACIKFSCALISVTQQREDDTSIYQKKKIIISIVHHIIELDHK
jgi:hypothetical protein